MGSFLQILLLFFVLQCLHTILAEEEDSSDFAILDELESQESCDGGCKAPGRKQTENAKNKQQSKQEQEFQLPPQLIEQYHHYLNYMQENSADEPPISQQEFAQYMAFMQQAQKEGLTPEEMQQKYMQKMQQEQQQQEASPEVQEELKSQLPDLSEKYDDGAYKSISDIPSNLISNKAFGCGVVEIPAGKFYMGSEHDDNYEEDGEAPYRKVKISKPYYLDVCEVTNAQFLEFWEKKNMKGKTEAEKYGWSFVFELLVSKDVNDQVHSAVQGAEWWIPIPGSDFRHPFGPDTSFNDQLDHPAMHIGWTDANKYCKWKGGRLPSESEWEYACRGGLEKKKFPWGNEITPNLTIDGTYSMNTFWGDPYSADDGTDGFPGTAPIGSYSPNGYGLYDMTGNLWEWTQDYWSPRPKIPPQGRRLVDPKGPKQGRDRVMKGGSYMCHPKTCRRYRCAGRSHAEPDSSTGNLGFRCAYDKDPNINNDDEKKEL